MSIHRQLGGVVVPLVTPLTRSGDIDCEAVGRLVEFTLSGCVDGLFALGSTGEFVSLPWNKQRTMLRAAVEACAGRVPVCAGVSSNCLDEIAERAAFAAEAGADYAVVLPPFYFRTSQPELERFFVDAAERSPIPLVIYNMPFRTQNDVAPATVETLAAHPRIAGIKDTVSDMVRTLDVLGRVAGRDDFVYLHGNELLSMPAILYGARGLVPSLANFAPRVMSDAFRAARDRDLAACARWQQRIQSLMRIFGLLEARPQDSTTLRLQAIKLALAERGVCGPTMAQLNEVPSDAQRARVREFLAAEGLAG